MNFIWAGIMLLSILLGILTGRSAEVSSAVFEGAKNAIELCLTLLASMCLWSGLMRIAEKAGITRVMGRIFRPFLRLLFPGLEPSSKAGSAISMNVAANVLGLGNAATPLGIKAMKELHKFSSDPAAATNNMIMFVVINTASVQILPTTIAAMRAQYGAASPMDIMPAVLLASAVSLAAGIIAVRILSLRRKRP